MPEVIPWGEDELQTLASNPTSRVFCEQKKIPVVLQPFHLQDLKSAVRDLLNASVNSFDRSLDGILLSYRHLKVLSKSASVAAETSGVVLEIQADFYVFRPEIGGILQGVVNKKSNDHVGVLLYHRYNVSCPRPRSDERSEKWLGNNVAMHQEVTIKLKERNFSGKLPFFKGKIVAVGKVLSKSVSETESKPKKKKSKEIEAESLSVLETSDAGVSKKSKRKLDDVSDDKNSAKKSKKDRDGSQYELSKISSVDSVAVEPSKKKKKRVSIGIAEEMDYIPRLSLDVSQLPENLPPPNADSTHFDLAKILPSKSEKKRRKENVAGLSTLREESAESGRDSSKIPNTPHTSSKSPLSNEEKSKKKKDKKHVNESEHLKDSPILSQKGLNSKTKVHESPKKKKGAESLSQDSKSGKRTEFQSVKSITEISQDFSKKKKHKHQEPTYQVEPIPPTKEKKSKKDKSMNVLPQLNLGLQESQGSYGKKSSVGEILSLTEVVTSSKGKKKLKDEGRNLSPSKHSSKKKDIDGIYENDSDSDDTIPPGQKLMRDSPLKSNAMGTPQKRESLLSVSFGKSPGIGYLPSTSMTDYDLGVKKGARPVIFGNLDGRILPPPESPVKTPKKNVRKQDSDSDTPQPKKVILSSSVRDQSSDSESGGANSNHPVSSSVTKSNHASKQSEDSSDSEYNMAVKNKLLQSMGVMQSPLKPATHNTKQDTSDSDCESSADEKEKNNSFSRLLKTLPLSLENGAQIHFKSKIVDKQKSSPAKQITQPKSKMSQKSKLSQSSKGKDILVSSTGPEDSDSDMEIMKTALQQLEQEKLSGVAPKRSTKQKPQNAAKNPEGSKKPPSILKKAVTLPKKTDEKSLSNSSVRKDQTVKNVSSVSSDSDSGPEDRNSSLLLEKMREEHAAGKKLKKTRGPGKQPKTPKELPLATVPKSKKPKSNSKAEKQLLSASKAAKNPKLVEKKGPPDVKKQKTKTIKKGSTDELSDVIQRLMQQAKLNVGLK